MKHNPVALHPDDVEFKPGETYYVKLKHGDSIQPIFCSQAGYGVSNERRGGVNTFAYATKADIDYVVGGVPSEVLHRAQQERVFGRRRVEGVEDGRGADASVPKPSLSEGRKAVA